MEEEDGRPGCGVWEGGLGAEDGPVGGCAFGDFGWEGGEGFPSAFVGGGGDGGAEVGGGVEGDS